MRNKIFELINNLKYFIVQIIFYLTLISSLIFAAEMKVYTSEEWERLRKQRYHDADLVIVGQGMSRTTRIVKTREEANEDGGKSHYTTLINNYWIKTIYTLKGTTSDSMLNVQSDSYTQCTISPPPKFEGIDEKGETLYSTIRRIADGGAPPNIPTQSMSIIFLQKKDTNFVLTYLTRYTKDELDFYKSIKEEVPILEAKTVPIDNPDTIHKLVSQQQISMVDMWENRFGDRNFNRMLKDLKTEKDPSVREDLIFELGNSYDTSAVQPLVEILQNDQWAPVRAQAAKSLITLGLGSADTNIQKFVKGKFGDDRSKTLLLLKENMIMPALKNALYDKDIYVVYNAASALVSLGDTEYLTLKVLFDIFRKKNIKKWKMEFVPRPDIPEEDQPKLKEMQDNDRAAIHGDALEVLKKVGNQYVIDELTKAFQDKDAWVRNKAKQTLEELKVLKGATPQR